MPTLRKRNCAHAAAAAAAAGETPPSAQTGPPPSPVPSTCIPSLSPDTPANASLAHAVHHRAAPAPTTPPRASAADMTDLAPPALSPAYIADLVTRPFDLNTNLFVQQVNEGNFPLAASFDGVFGQIYGPHWALRRRLVLGMR